MNKLFHKFQSRQFQFALELMSHLSVQKEVPNHTLYEMAVQYGLEHADKCIVPMLEYGLLQKTRKGVRMADDLMPPKAPLSNLEEEYLQYILQLPEAKLFLNPTDRDKLCSLQEPLQMEQFQYHRVLERMPAPDMDPKEFQNILYAIRNRRWIHYEYRTKENREFVQATAVPWKLEFSAYDGRWWVILYLPDEQRTVKAWLPNLQKVQLGNYSDVTDDEIEMAMQKLLVDDMVVIRISPEKNALERCARVFERQMLQNIQREADGYYKLSFRYYGFDKSEILRKLLYLGPTVQLLKPQELRKDLLQLVNQALDGDSYQF